MIDAIIEGHLRQIDDGSGMGKCTGNGEILATEVLVAEMRHVLLIGTDDGVAPIKGGTQVNDGKARLGDDACQSNVI